MRYVEPHLPAEPILECFARLRARTITPFHATASSSPISDAGFPVDGPDHDRFDKAIARAIRQGYITVRSADELCCTVLRVHPFQVYGDAWWVASAGDLEEAS